ncbi:EXOS7-like protein [Mya arenaria]|uniref:Ribosomal RNA-processing protein 42 n=1 Tax=Mya arenaria TaxID=6604 RepID=A0ABY7EQV5_MYAAR|nr:EXOS7-like protein [Mya arenaria]
MADIHLSDAEKTFTIHGVQDNLREDGRSCEDFRHMEIATNVISNTSGSAKVRLANTEILVGVKAELGDPDPDKPDRGRLDSANATPEFEGRGGEELATEISSMLARAYQCPSCLDMRQLSVVQGKQCWVIYVDVLLLECGVSQDEGHVELELSDDPFDVQRIDVTSAPCIVTLSKIGHSHIVDASKKEEACCLARLMIGVTDNGTVTAMKKEGSGSLDTSSVDDMLETGKRVGQGLNKSLMEVLISDDKTGRKKYLTGFLR